MSLQASMEELIAAKMAAQASGNRVQLIWPPGKAVQVDLHIASSSNRLVVEWAEPPPGHPVEPSVGPGDSEHGEANSSTESSVIRVRSIGILSLESTQTGSPTQSEVQEEETREEGAEMPDISSSPVSEETEPDIDDTGSPTNPDAPEDMPMLL